MNTEVEKATSRTGDKRNIRKASTNELPMVDLAAVLEFASRIEEDGLQTLSQQEVSNRLGYAAYTSTPFYRRIVAAKLFGLLDTTQGVTLTKLALDYFKPTDEQAKGSALVTAVKNVIGYQRILERYSGRRLPPVDILKNAIERDFRLTDEVARACADVLIRSVQRASMVGSDGALITEKPEKQFIPETSASASPGPSFRPEPPDGNIESHYLTLDARQGRRVVVQAPPTITEAELKRIQNWLAVQLHVVASIGDEATGSAGGEIIRKQEP